MIQCKRVYDAANEDDGYRILVDDSGREGLKNLT